MPSYIDKTVNELEKELIILNTKRTSIIHAIELLRNLYSCPEQPAEPDQQDTKAPSEQSQTARTKKKYKPRKPVGKSSRYKGVSLKRGRWNVQYYNSQKKKLEYVGSYDTEIQAAQAYFDYKHKIEGTNKTRKSQLPGDISEPGIELWKCVSCGKKFIETIQPEQCSCGSVSLVPI